MVATMLNRVSNTFVFSQTYRLRVLASFSLMIDLVKEKKLDLTQREAILKRPVSIRPTFSLARTGCETILFQRQNTSTHLAFSLEGLA